MYLQQLVFSNVRGYGTGTDTARLNFARPDGSYAGWTVIAGRNGSGKTTLLRAIALALAGPSAAKSLSPSFKGWISEGQEEAVVQAAFSTGFNDNFASGGRLPKKQAWAGLGWKKGEFGPEPTLEEKMPANAPVLTPRRGPWYENPVGWFVAGYGPFRRLSGAASEAQRLMLGPQRVAALVTLFDESASLAEAMWWLQDLYPKVLEGDVPSKQLMEGLMAMIGDGLLPDDHHVAGYDSHGLWVERNGKRFLIEDLSDGYRTIAALVLDICRRLYAANREFAVTVDENGSTQCLYEGIVLIDEVDVHLHVSWQQALGPWLKSHFPKIQFIVSSHSPFICQAASPNGLIRLPAPGEEDRRPRLIGEELYRAIVHGGSDVAVESELFGLASARSSETMVLNSQLVELEKRVVLGQATESDVSEMRRIRAAISPSAKSEALNTLAALQLSMETGLA